MDYHFLADLVPAQTLGLSELVELYFAKRVNRQNVWREDMALRTQKAQNRL